MRRRLRSHAARVTPVVALKLCDPAPAACAPTCGNRGRFRLSGKACLRPARRPAGHEPAAAPHFPRPFFAALSSLRIVAGAAGNTLPQPGRWRIHRSAAMAAHLFTVRLDPRNVAAEHDANDLHPQLSRNVKMPAWPAARHAHGSRQRRAAFSAPASLCRFNQLVRDGEGDLRTVRRAFLTCPSVLNTSDCGACRRCPHCHRVRRQKADERPIPRDVRDCHLDC